MKIAVVGLGKLGAPLAAVLASRGHRVTGVDLDPSVVDKVQAGIVPVEEPGLQKLMDSLPPGGLTATMNGGAASATAEVVFVIVPTPSLPDGRFSHLYVEEAARTIGRAMKGATEYKLTVLVSTVMPGDTERYFIPTLEAESGRQHGAGFGVCYNPEFIALGSVLAGIEQPDFVLIGHGSVRAREGLTDLYRRSILREPPAHVACMNFASAEIAKLALNCYVTTKISFANMLSEFCEKTPGANVYDVTQALGHDTRIGAKFFKPATAYGGPCFPRDARAFIVAAKERGVQADIPAATDRINARQTRRLRDFVSRHCQVWDKIAILGVTYKPDTHITEESAGDALADDLRGMGVFPTVCDPSQKDQYDLEGTMRWCDAAILTTPWPEFQSIRPEWLERTGDKVTIVDCWNMLPHLANVAHYIVPGVGR